MSALPAPLSDPRTAPLTALVEVEDGDLVFVSAGPRAADALDVPADRIAGRSARALGFPSSVRAQWVEALASARRDGRVAQVALSYDTSREVRRLVVTATPVDAQAGRFACVIEDDTAPRQLFEALVNGRPTLDAMTALRQEGAFTYGPDFVLIEHGGVLPEGLVPVEDGVPGSLVGASLYDLLPKTCVDVLARALLDPPAAPPRTVRLPGDAYELKARAVRDARGWPVAGLAVIEAASDDEAPLPAAPVDHTATLLRAGHERIEEEVRSMLDAFNEALPVSSYPASLRWQGRAVMDTLATLNNARTALERPAPPEPIRVDALLQTLRGVLESMAEAHELNLFFFTPDQPVWALGHREAFGQALLGAARYAMSTTARGALRLALRQQEDAVTVQVADTGTGMADAVRRAVFDAPTASVDAVTPDLLDLVAARVLTEAMGGSVEARGESGRGTVLSFRLPSVEAPADEDTAPQQTSLVLIEPDRDTRALLDLFLRDDWGIHPTQSIDEALDLVNLHLDAPKIDAVLLDLSSDPDTNAQAALSQLRLHPSFDTAFVVALVASSLPEERDRILRLGFDGVLAKPFSRTELQNVLTLPQS